MPDAPETPETTLVPVIYTGLDPWTTPSGRLLVFDDHAELPKPIADRLIAKGWATTPDEPATAESTTPPATTRRTTTKGQDS